MGDLFKDVLLPKVRKAEAGYVNNPADHGGETIWGITKETARRNGYSGPMSAMTQAQADTILEAEYWVRPHLNLVATQSPKIAAVLFDIGVNHGPGTAAIFLQRILNVLNRQGRDYADIAVDGGIGTQTVSALWQLFHARGVPTGETSVLKLLICLRGARYVEIAEHDATQEEFENGWTTRLDFDLNHLAA